MPTDTIVVDRLSVLPTTLPDTRSFIVQGHYLDGRLGWLQVSTVNIWAASICQRALEQQVPIVVTWKDTRYGPNLITVRFATDIAVDRDAQVSRYLNKVAP